MRKGRLAGISRKAYPGKREPRPAQVNPRTISSNLENELPGIWNLIWLRPPVVMQPGEVRGRAESGIGLPGAGEGGAGLVALTGLGERFRGRLQGLRSLERSAGVVIALRSLDQPSSVVVQQGAAVQAVRLPMRDL